jgi:hypothetical protein
VWLLARSAAAAGTDDPRIIKAEIVHHGQFRCGGAAFPREIRIGIDSDRFQRIRI